MPYTRKIGRRKSVAPGSAVICGRIRIAIFILAAIQLLLSVSHNSSVSMPVAEMEENSKILTANVDIVNNLPILLKRVISFSLYGDKIRYWGGALPNVKLAREIYPGWTVRFYYDDLVPNSVLEELSLFANVELFNMSQTPITNPRMWRFLVATDVNVKVYIMRDVDGRLDQRERDAVQEWLQSNYSFHVMHDHPGHCGKPIQAGMWGGRRNIPEMKCALERCNTALLTDQHWDDANQLEEFVWPVVRTDMLHHDSFCCGKFNETTLSRPFPTKRKGGEHVGNVHVPTADGFTTRERDASMVIGRQECH